MKLDALDHPKTLDFAARLNVELPTALGHLELFWAFAAKKAPQGNIGKWPDGSIARACYWNADPTVFVTALASAGFLDRDKEHRWLVHDWRDHAPRWVMSQLARAKLTILDSSGDSTSECSADCSRDSSADSVRHGMAGVGMAGDKSGASAPSPSRDQNGSAGKPRKRPANKKPQKTTIPDGFGLDPELEQYVIERLPGADPPAVMDSFRGKAEAKGWTYVNWRQAFQEYVRNCAPNSGHWAAGQYPKVARQEPVFGGGWQ